MHIALTELKNVCASHGIARRNFEIQGLFATFFRLNYYFVANFQLIFGKCSRMKQWCSKYILYPYYRMVCSESSKLSCSTYVLARAENLAAFQFFKIPPFYYSVAMVSLLEPAKGRDTRRRFSALSIALH